MFVVFLWDAVLHNVHGLEVPECIEVLEKLGDGMVPLAPVGQHGIRRRSVPVHGLGGEKKQINVVLGLNDMYTLGSSAYFDSSP